MAWTIFNSGATVAEDSGSVTLSVHRSTTGFSETVYMSTVQNQGVYNIGDYVGQINSPLTFASYEAIKTITIQINPDPQVEPDETFGVIVQQSPSDPLGTFLASSTFTILNDDSALSTNYSLTPSVSTVTEGNQVTFTITRSGDRPSETVYFSTLANGTATYAAGDYATTSGGSPANIAVNFSSGQTSKTVTLNILNDGTPDSGESFRAIVQRSASDPVSTFLDRSSYVTINDNGTTPPPTPTDTVANGTNTTATLGVGQTINGTIDQDDLDGNYIDADYYKVILTAGQGYTFSANANLSTTDTLDQVFMRLRDGNGNTITSSSSAEGAAPSFTYDVPGSGSQTYYLAISAGGGGAWWDKTGDFSISLTANGTATVANQTPYAQGSSNTVAAGESVSLTDLFTYGDRDGLSDIVSFAVNDRTLSGGYLTFDGQKMDSNTIFERSIAEIDRWAFVAGDEGTDTIGFNVIDNAGKFNPSAVAAISVSSSAPIELSATEIFEKVGLVTTFAKFAMAAYTRKSEYVSEILNDGWKLFTTTEIIGLGSEVASNFQNGRYIAPSISQSIFGSSAEALIAKSGDGRSLFISFEGSEDITDWLTDGASIFSDAPFKAHYELFRPLLDSLALDFNKYDNIYVAGHSLGAAMAQAFKQEYASYDKITAITFANPGYNDGVPGFVSGLANILISGDIIEAANKINVVEGDLYKFSDWNNDLSAFERHYSPEYLKIAKYIDKMGYDIFSDSKDSIDNSTPYSVQRDFGGIIYPDRVDISWSTGFLSPGQVFSTSIETTSAGSSISISPNAYTKSDWLVHAGVTAAGAAGVILNTGGKVIGAIDDFRELAFNAAIVGGKFILKALLDADISNNTVYFNGNIGDDIADGSEADRRFVADGGAGNDELTGGLMGDDLRGGAGDDNIQGGLGDDFIRDALGDNIVDGGVGSDQIILFSGTNTARGGSGNDFLIGGIQGDQLFGDAGNDVIIGDIGSFGGADIINGGTGNDIMMGGVGADVFVFSTNDGSDIIADIDVAAVSFDAINGYAASPTGADFEIGIDRIQLEGFTTVNAANVLGFITSTAQGAVFSAEGTDITFYGIDSASLTASDFLFL